MRQAFQVSASATPWTNQPITEKVIAVSTSAGDGSKNLVLQGTVSAAPDGETITFASDGRIEKESTKTYEALIAASLSASAAGTVRIYGQGNAASGTVIVSTNPAPGDTWTIGLVGNTRNYKFVSKGQTTILCGADVAGSLAGTYFDVALSGASAKRFWYRVSGGGSAPADPGGGLTAIDITTGDTAAAVATATEAILEAVTNLTCTVDTATVTVNYDIWGTMTFTDGTTTFTFTAVSPGYADAANNVTIGATVSDTAANLNKAINDTGTEGTHYGTGTTINEYLSSTVSGSIVTITDKIACDRYLGWTTTQSGTGLSLSGPTGGVNGTILGTIGVGTTGIQDAFTLDNETLDAVSANFPGTITPTFDAIFVGGAPFRVYAARGTGSNVVFKIMGGHSSSTCTEEILTGLTAGSATYEVKPGISKASTTILCVAASAMTTGDYFDLILSGGSTKRFWYNIASGGGAPADPGGGLTAIAIGGSDTAAQVATATEAVLEAVTNLTCTVDTATVTVNYDISGTMTFTDGNTTHTFTAVSPGYADTTAPSGFEYIQPICTSNGNSAPIQLAAYVVSG